MRKNSFSVLLALAGFGVIGATAPDTIMAQVCEGSCKVCSEGGHSYGTAGSPALGYQYHGCGNQTICGQGVNVHDPCGNDLVKWLWEYELLDGEKLRDIVVLSEGRIRVNLARAAIQEVHCLDETKILVHLPLAARQISEYLVVVAQESAGTGR